MKQIVLFVFIFILFQIPCSAQKSKLKVLGTVIAEELSFGHIYSDKIINIKHLIVRLNKVIEGKEESQYILIKYKWRLKDYPTSLDTENESQWEFSLKKDNSCNKSLREIQYALFADDKGKINGLLPALKRKQGAETEQLPFSVTLPCYQINYKNSKINPSFTPRQRSSDLTGSNLFVLETELIENEPNTPFIISWFGNGSLIFTNVSPKLITSFQLGCTIKRENTIQILSRMSVTIQNVDPDSSLLTPKASGGTTDNMDELFTCYQSKAKLTVIEVNSKDGSVWKLK
jgi:hypothetical protein